MLHAILRDQLSISTWLLVGAGIQTIGLAVLPVKYVAATTLGLLAFVATRTVLRVIGWIEHSPSPPVIPGRYSPRPPSSLDPQPMTVFILGFQSSHPLGRFAPGIKELGEYFNGIIKEAESEKSTSGYLGSSGSMLTMDGDAHNALITISYWNDLAKLEQFSKQGVHLRAIKWFNEHRVKFPHIGIYPSCGTLLWGGGELTLTQASCTRHMRVLRVATKQSTTTSDPSAWPRHRTRSTTSWMIRRPYRRSWPEMAHIWIQCTVEWAGWLKFEEAPLKMHPLTPTQHAHRVAQVMR